MTSRVWPDFSEISEVAWNRYVVAFEFIPENVIKGAD